MIKNRYRQPLLAILSGLLAACGGSSGDAPAAPGGTNRPPTISGTPLTSVLQGNAYSFTPSAADADGNALTFSVANLPGWAAFNAGTGGVSGTPSAADVGTYGNIAISVSDGTASVSLPSFSIQVVATATGSATLTWSAPTENTNGSPLTDLAGYTIHWGTSPGNLTNSVTIDGSGLSTYVVDQLTPATWYFALRAVNAAGVESALSNVESKVVP